MGTMHKLDVVRSERPRLWAALLRLIVCYNSPAHHTTMAMARYSVRFDGGYEITVTEVDGCESD